eukprot:scaffold30406_cov52-Attheya_sp.AAC.2
MSHKGRCRGCHTAPIQDGKNAALVDFCPYGIPRRSIDLHVNFNAVEGHERPSKQGRHAGRHQCFRSHIPISRLR